MYSCVLLLFQVDTIILYVIEITYVYDVNCDIFPNM